MSQVYQGGVLYINGLPVAHSGPGGHATAKEECWVTVGGQKVKQVFTNIAHASDLECTTMQIFTDGYPIATKASFTNQSYGDEDSEGGVKSGTKLGKLEFKSASPNVTFEGAPVVRHTDVIISNNGNTEESKWVQPSKSSPAIARLESAPLEDLPTFHAVNIQLIRNPAVEFSSPSVQQLFLIEHDQTKHQTYHTFGVFKELENTYLWHGDFLREGTYSAYEIFPKQGNQTLKIPLGKINAVSKTDNTPGLKLVPLSFRRYDDMQSSKESIKTPYQHSYLYLFKDGYLWRELEINHLGRLYEVDLPYFTPEKLRYASAELTQGVLLPIEDATGKHEFHIAVSHIRWTWRMIHIMGGFDPSDPRYKPTQHLTISKDQDFIHSRLHKIDIHSFVSEGEACTSIDASQTQDSIAGSVHTCQPSPSNKEWIVDRDKLNHSSGTTQVLKHLIWDAPGANPLPSYVHPESAEAQKVNIVPGAAIYILQDPLGRLIETSEFMVDEHLKYMEYVEQEGEKYALGTLVGKVLESSKENGNNYYKHVNEFYRSIFVRQYENRRESYLALMKESTEVLKFWFEASHNLNQWQDFFAIAKDKSEINLLSKKYHEITQNIYAAFLLTPEGISNLREDVKRENSKIMSANLEVATWLSVEQSMSLFKNTMNIMSATQEVDEFSLEKIQNFYETATHTKLNARLIQIPESDLIAHHRAMMIQHEPTISTKLKVQSGLVTKIPTERVTPKSQKMITIVEFEGLPAYKTQTLISSLQRELPLDDKTKLENLADRVNNSAPLRAALSALLIFNTRGLINQIDKLEAEGNLVGGGFNVYHAEILRNAVVVSELSAEAVGLMTKKIAGGKLSAGAMGIAKKLNVSGIFISVLVDGWHLYRDNKSGEGALMTSHAVSIIATTLVLISQIISTARLSHCLGYIGYGLGLVAALSVIYFSKNDLERWLYQSHWGYTEGNKDIPKHSLEWFHFMMPQVHIKSFAARDKRGMLINDDIEKSFEARFGFSSSPILNSAEDFYWIVQLPETQEVSINCTLLVMTSSGMHSLSDEHIDITSFPNLEGQIIWKISVSSRFFPKHGILGRLLFQVESVKSGNLLGQDAYEFELNLINHAYEFKKVMYGSYS